MQVRVLWLSMFVACSGADKTDSDTDTTGDADADTDTDADADADSDADTDAVVCTAPTGDPATVELAGECPLEDKLGTGFSVDILADYSIIAGQVANGVVPVTVLEPMAVDGPCKLLRRNNPFCEPQCEAGKTCDFDDDGDGLGDCIDFPLNQDLGTVTVCGMVEDVVMTPVQPGTQYFDVTLPHPVFEPGQLIELQTHGTTFGSDIVLHGVGVAPIALEGDSTWVVREGEDLPITWNSAGDSLRSEIQVRLNIDQHGNTPVTLYCDFPDTGSASLSGTLLDQLMSFGVTGFPNATITRRTVDSTTVEGGCVQFAVTSPVNPDVRVDGFIPCNNDTDCYGYGLTNCNDLTYICE